MNLKWNVTRNIVLHNDHVFRTNFAVAIQAWRDIEYSQMSPCFKHTWWEFLKWLPVKNAFFGERENDLESLPTN